MTNSTLPTVAEFATGKIHLANLKEIVSGASTVTTPEGVEHKSLAQHLSEIEKRADSALASMGFDSLGAYESNPTIENINQTVYYSATDTDWRLKDGVARPYLIDSSTYSTPSSDSNLQLVSRRDQVSSIDALKTRGPETGYSVYLSNGEQSGWFEWMVGDYSNNIAIDTDNVFYVPSNSDSAALYGCWVRSDLSITPEKFSSGEAGFRAAYEHLIRLAVSNGINMPLPRIKIKGKYLFSAEMELYPWIKFEVDGPTILDFTSLSDDGRGLVLTNEHSVPDVAYKNAANTGPIFSNVVFIDGPGKTTDDPSNTVGITTGNSVYDSDELQDFRDVLLSNIVVTGFQRLYDFIPNDNYLQTIRDAHFEGAGEYVMYFNGTNKNSGERITIMNSVLGGSPNGVYMNSDAVDLNFISSSLDFCRNWAFYFGAASGYQKVTLTDCHLEVCNDLWFAKSESALQIKPYLTIKDCKLLPRNSDTTLDNVRADKRSVPRIPLFQGAMNLKIDGLVVPYEYTMSNAESGLFLCDDDVRIVSCNGVEFVGWRQPISQHLVLNRNWNFNEFTVGETIQGKNVKGWNNYSALGLTAEISDDDGFYNSSVSIKLTGTQADNYYVIESNLFSVENSKNLINQQVIKATNSTGNLNVTATIVPYNKGNPNQGIKRPITTLGRNGTFAEVICPDPHNLVVGSEIMITGCDQTNRNGLQTVNSVFDEYTFGYCLNNDGSDYAATTTDGIYFEETELVVVGETVAYNDSFSAIYQDTTNVSYTGDRDYWARAKLVFDHTPLKDVLIGVTHAKFLVTVSELDVGDVVYLGGALVSKA
jgi:hypothetical protein